jgi:hypothetical protein
VRVPVGVVVEVDVEVEIEPGVEDEPAVVVVEVPLSAPDGELVGVVPAPDAPDRPERTLVLIFCV